MSDDQVVALRDHWPSRRNRSDLPVPGRRSPARSGCLRQAQTPRSGAAVPTGRWSVRPRPLPALLGVDSPPAKRRLLVHGEHQHVLLNADVRHHEALLAGLPAGRPRIADVIGESPWQSHVSHRRGTAGASGGQGRRPPRALSGPRAEGAAKRAPPTAGQCSRRRSGPGLRHCAGHRRADAAVGQPGQAARDLGDDLGRGHGRF